MSSMVNFGNCVSVHVPDDGECTALKWYRAFIEAYAQGARSKRLYNTIRWVYEICGFSIESVTRPTATEMQQFHLEGVSVPERWWSLIDQDVRQNGRLQAAL